MSSISDVGLPPLPASPGGPAERLLTVADLAALPGELPSGPARYERDNGRLIIMAPPGESHGSVEIRIASPLFTQGEVRGFGKAYCGEIGIVLWRNPDRVVGADAAFVGKGSLPPRLSPEGYLETLPDLVVEIMSKNDYLKAGVRVVWVADPSNRTITEFRPGQEKVYKEKDILTIEDVIPGFHLSLADIFRA